MQNEIVTPQKALGLLAVEFWAMHFVELKRWQDFRNPGSVDADPLFPQNKLPAHEVGYPGGIFAPFVVGGGVGGGGEGGGEPTALDRSCEGGGWELGVVGSCQRHHRTQHTCEAPLLCAPN
jgi:hypothetical protein